MSIDDARLRTAIAFGFGATQEDAAEFAGKSISSVKRWRVDPDLSAIINAVAAYRSIHASKHVKDAVAESVGSAEDRIKALFDRSLRLSERRLKRAEDEGDDVTTETLKEIHADFTKFFAKFTASEAPKRLQIDGTVEHKYKAVISIEEARNILATDALVEKQRLIAGASDVIDIIPDA